MYGGCCFVSAVSCGVVVHSVVLMRDVVHILEWLLRLILGTYSSGAQDLKLTEHATHLQYPLSPFTMFRERRNLHVR